MRSSPSASSELLTKLEGVGEVLLPKADDTTRHEVILLFAGEFREHDTGTLVDSLLRSAPCLIRRERLVLTLQK